MKNTIKTGALITVLLILLAVMVFASICLISLVRDLRNKEPDIPIVTQTDIHETPYQEEVYEAKLVTLANEGLVEPTGSVHPVVRMDVTILNSHMPVEETLEDGEQTLEEFEEVSEEEHYSFTDDDVYCLACVIYQEAGGDCCSDDTRRKVADVVLNRVASEYFPNTIREVLEDAPNGALQYGTFALTGVQFPPSKENLESEKEAIKRAWMIAYDVASGNHSDIYGQGYIWQAEFGQGYEGFWQDNIYFGRNVNWQD